MTQQTPNRRFPPPLPQSADLPWEQARRAIFEALRWARDAASGIPGGFQEQDPSTIEPDAAADAGTESSGWAAADHEHAIATAQPLALSLGVSGSEGDDTSFARSDHVHDTNTLRSEIIALIEEEAYLSWVM